ncbi:MAG TPA: class I SAM-dependent methyltransferase [Anaerolineae bacterium]|nr:class I SAM-dependent methyltransferase [Anaerolineae bacterium]
MEAVHEVFNLTIPELGEIPALEKPCLLCGRRDFAPLNSFVLNQRRFHTVRCRHDGMMWLDPQPTEAFYQELYSQRYHAAGPDDPLLEQATLDVHSNPAERQRVAEIRLQQIEEFAAPGRLLEAGFGHGAMLITAASRGWQVVGLELDQGCVDRMHEAGVAALRGSLLDYDGEAASFDVVGMYSVIEHTLDPAAHLEKARALLKPGGLLVLRLPETAAEGPPASLIAHTYHFDAHTIMVLLRRCGFEVLRIDNFALWKPTRYPGELWNMNVVSRKKNRNVPTL